MQTKKTIAKLLKKIAKGNVASASGITLYQPEVPESLKKEDE